MIVIASALVPCHCEPFALCHCERSEAISRAQGRLREAIAPYHTIHARLLRHSVPRNDTRKARATTLGRPYYITPFVVSNQKLLAVRGEPFGSAQDRPVEP